MKSFSDFNDREDRKNKEKLHTISLILKSAGYKTHNHLNDHDEPYIFVRKPSQHYPILENLTFNGIRIYTRGKDIICYRIQNKENTEPFGETYRLDIKKIFQSLVGDVKKREKIGVEVAKYIIEEIKDFFLESAKAEETEPEEDIEGSMGVVTPSSNNDYANMVTQNDPRGK